MRKGTAYRKGKEKRKSLREKVFDLIQEKGEISTSEISETMGVKIHSISGRLSELEERGLIYQKGQKHHKEQEAYTVWQITPVELIEQRKAENWNKRMVIWLQKGLNNGFINKKQFSELDKQGKLF